MQFTQADSNNTRRVGVQEDLIKFRPSPNFKNMKKFLKNRNNYELLPEQNVVPVRRSPTPPAQAVAPAQAEPPPEVKPVVAPPPAQPPLPPYPPPPDTPPNLNITIKQEQQDEEDLLNSERQPSPSLLQPELELASGRPESKTKKTMCKEFIRGDCKRTVCRFSHELDLAQLRGVFTFCWNYQNTKCTYPYCKFVHATVFEEAEFYRTGILPPHARSHMKKPHLPSSVNEGAGPSNYVPNAQPPPMYPGMDKPMGVIRNGSPKAEWSEFEECAGPSNYVPNTQPPLMYPGMDKPMGVIRNGSPKAEWSEFEESSSSPRDLETNEPLAKKCKNCDMMEFRLQYYKEKVEGMIQARDEMAKKTAVINKKSKKISLVLLTLMKPGNNLKGGVASGLASGDKERAVLEQLGQFINTSRLSSVPADRDDPIKNAYGEHNNLPRLMAKICGNDQPLTADTSRET